MQKKYAALVAAVIVVVSLAGCSATGSGSSAAGNSASGSAAKTNWFDSTYGKFTPVTTTGTTDSIIKLPAGAKAGIITASYTGSGNFIISVLDSTNQPTIDGPVNAIGNYAGVSGFGFVSVGNPGTQLKVTGQGKWSITVAPVSSAPTKTPATGTGDSVFLYSGGAATWALSGRGKGNFIVTEYSANPMPGINVNAIGAYTGKDPVDAGPAAIVIKADGPWTIG
jgi:hypothetical protein